MSVCASAISDAPTKRFFPQNKNDEMMPAKETAMIAPPTPTTRRPLTFELCVDVGFSIDEEGYSHPHMSSSTSDATLDATRITKPASASNTEMTEYVLPQHANALGTVFGGQIMAWVDLCAAICAQRHAGKTAVTAFVDDVKFQEPVKVGEVVRLHARLTATFRTSMEIEVVVEGEDPRTQRIWPCVNALVVFVAINEHGKPVVVPLLDTSTAEARASQAAGEARRSARLAKR